MTDFLKQTTSGSYTPPELSTDRPTPARIYDYLLGGKDNFAVDRTVAEQVESREPNARMVVAENRAFLRRVVRYLVAEAGIRQIIDLGSGLPTQDNVHQVAQRHAPDTRVVYVDNDPIVLAHGRAILEENGHTSVITADMTRPQEILDHPETRRLIDFTRPWALLCVAILHFLPEDPRPSLAEYRERMPPGSFLALSHVSLDAARRSPEATRIAEDVVRMYEESTSPLVLRGRDEIVDLFTGFEFVEPGLELVMNWRPEQRPHLPEHAWIYGGVGELPR